MTSAGAKLFFSIHLRSPSKPLITIRGSRARQLTELFTSDEHGQSSLNVRCVELNVKLRVKVEHRILFVNHFSGNRLGSEQALVYFGGPDGYAPDRRQEIPAWGAVESLCCDLDDDGYAEIVLANWVPVWLARA